MTAERYRIRLVSADGMVSRGWYDHFPGRSFTRICFYKRDYENPDVIFWPKCRRYEFTETRQIGKSKVYMYFEVEDPMRRNP